MEMIQGLLSQSLRVRAPRIYNFVQYLRGRRQYLSVDYANEPIPRYGHGKPAHPQILELLARQRSTYIDQIDNILGYADELVKIPLHSTVSGLPHWINGFLPGLDSAAIYAQIAATRPQLYLEIGSGNSTKFAALAAKKWSPQTKIVSIDPHPRAEVDALCDEVIRQPVENVDLSIFESLESGDILFVDNSHRCFTNSDVTVFFLDILPRLAPGVLLQIHDICLPYDYPAEVAKAWYSEQYLLACCLLNGGNRLIPVFPAAYVAQDEELSRRLAPLWDRRELRSVERHGCSFWAKIQETNN